MGSVGLKTQHVKLVRKIDGRIRGMIGEKELSDKCNKNICIFIEFLNSISNNKEIFD